MITLKGEHNNCLVYVSCCKYDGFVDISMVGYRKNEAVDYIENKSNFGGIVALFTVRLKRNA